MTKTYYGTKRVTAWRDDLRHAEDAPPESYEGYSIKYADGYGSWSPKAVFEAAYMPVDAMDFGRALQAMRDGYWVRREMWLRPESEPDWDKMSRSVSLQDGKFWYHDPLGPRSSDIDKSDILATDWMIVEEEEAGYYGGDEDQVDPRC